MGLDKETGWKWFASQSNEEFTEGPFDSRVDAIEEGKSAFDGEPFYIVEARQDPLQLSKWLYLDRLLEDAEERLYDHDRVCSEFDEPPYFPMTTEQEKDLYERIRKAVDEWQAAHGLVFKVTTFSASRNEEHVA